jgi:hypothetical protein
VVVSLKVFESESFYNSRVGGWETSLTAQRFDPPALKSIYIYIIELIYIYNYIFKFGFNLV